NALNVRLLARYQIAQPSYRRWAVPQPAPDFRITPLIRAGDFPALQPVTENGEILHGSFGEAKEQIQVAAHAVQMTISRTMIVNDRLGAIDQVLGSAGARVSDWENQQAYAALTAASGVGPTLLTDSKAVFHTDHANLAGSGSAITVTSVGAGGAALMKQT